MLIFGHRLLRPTACLAAALWVVAASACNVPVFRYALERWEADPYEIVVFHNGSLTEEQQALVEGMEKTGRDLLANLTVTRVNLAGELPPSLQTLWRRQANASPPWMVVRYPQQTGIENSAWAGPLNAETVKALLDSPARRDITQKLLRGDAVVWLLLGGGDGRRDDRVRQKIETELRQLEQSLVLPERSELDPPINPDLPLKIAFSTVGIAHADPAEQILVNLLLNWNTNLHAATEPMLFPIFGRGRAVSPVVGGQITAEAIRDMAEFLTGPCSCEVKAINPGYDLLLAANWRSVAGSQEAGRPDPPRLTGMSQFAVAAATNPVRSSDRPALSLAVSTLARPATGRQHLVRNLATVLGIGVGALAATTLVLRVRAGRRPR